MYLVYGNNSIIPNNISKKPDIYTRDSLYGRIGGTILTNHIGLVKCLMPIPTYKIDIIIILPISNNIRIFNSIILHNLSLMFLYTKRDYNHKL